MLMMVMMIMVVKQHQQRGMQDEDGSQRNPVSCSQECRSLQQRETRTFISLHPSTVQTCDLAIFLYPHVFKHSAEPKNAKVQESKDEGRNTADTAFAPSQWRLFKQSVSSHSSSAVLKYLFVVQYCTIFKQREFGAATAHTAPPARRPDESAASQNLNLDKPESHGKLKP